MLDEIVRIALESRIKFGSIQVVDHKVEQGLSFETHMADKGCADEGNHYYLELHQLHSAIRLKKTHTEKED